MHKINIKNARYHNDYQIFLEFDDNKTGIIDLREMLFDKDPGVFEKLRDKEKFQNFTIKSHTLAWDDDLDLAPEFLYDLLEFDN